MPIPVHILKQAIDLYVGIVYPNNGAPPAVAERIKPLQALDPQALVPVELLERDPANAMPSYALRLGQPLYPHMKLVIEPAPGGAGGGGEYLMRVDAHDRHLHAPPGSPDAAWLQSIRNSNKDLTERVEAAWSQAGLPTFKDYLRRQLLARKSTATPPAQP
jgi:hypothetical protein